MKTAIVSSSSLAESIEVVERGEFETVQQWFESLAVLGRSGGRESSHGSTVKSVLGHENLVFSLEFR